MRAAPQSDAAVSGARLGARGGFLETTRRVPVRSGLGPTTHGVAPVNYPIRLSECSYAGAGAAGPRSDRSARLVVGAGHGRRAPVENRLPIFAKICRIGREYVDAHRQKVIDELWSAAQESGLIELVGLTHAQLVLAVSEPAAADKIAVGEYDGLSGTFAEACREADQRVLIKKNPRDKQTGRSTRDAVDFLLSRTMSWGCGNSSKAGQRRNFIESNTFHGKHQYDQHD